MGGDDSQKLLPWREIRSPPGRSKPPAHCRINTVTETAVGISRAPPSPASLAMASATASLGHFWKAQVGQFWRAPKRLLRREVRARLAFASGLLSRSRFAMSYLI